jgi:hypothetical protein
MENVTREVITDLWPVYVSGEASPDTRGLVEAFLREDPELARKLSPDLKGPRWLLLLAMVFTMQAFGRIVSDTSFVVSPRAFIATAVVAACFWLAFLVRLFQGRRQVLIRIRR